MEQVEQRTLLSVDLNWSGGGIVAPANADAPVPITVSRTYNVADSAAPADFAISYYSSTDNVLGNGDDVLLASETITGAGATVGTHAGNSPSLQFNQAGSYHLFAVIDNGNTVVESDETNNATEAAQTVTVGTIIDNGTAGHSQTGAWVGFNGGYGGTASYAAPGAGTTSATWQQSGLASGNYQVDVTWLAGTNRASNATYLIFDGNASTPLKSVQIDQRNAPTGTVVGGTTFQSLGSVAISSGTLRVVLSNNANNYVIADAVRFTPLPAPAFDLNWSGGGVSAPATADTQAPFTVDRTYNVVGTTDDFAIAYYGSTDAILGNGDDVLLATETITGAGKTVGTHNGASPALQFTRSGTYHIFAVIDPAGLLPESSELNNTVEASAPVVVSGPSIIDNGTTDYSQTGTWVGFPGGHGGTASYAAPGDGSTGATWQQAGLSAGYYDVQVTWLAGTNRASNATYLIYDGSTLVRTVQVDQRNAPTGTVVGGTTFQSLGSVSISSGTLKVVLTNNANNYVIADAVRFAPVAPPTFDLNWSGGGVVAPANADTQTPFTVTRTYNIADTAATADFVISYYASTDAILGNGDDVLLATETITGAGKTVGTHAGASPALQFTRSGTYHIFAVIDPAGLVPESNEANNTIEASATVAASGPSFIDNGTTDYSKTGTWASFAGGHGGTASYAAPGDGSAASTWQQSGVPSGYYDVQVTWLAGTNRASNATYLIYDGSTLLATVPVDQRNAPTGTVVGGSTFQSLGKVAISSGTLKVVLTNNANNYVIADAVRYAPSVSIGLASDTGSSNTDQITNDTTPTFTGVAVAGTTISLFDGSTLLGTTTANGSGSWTFTAGTLADGVHSITAQSTPVVGSPSTSNPLSVTIDSQAPSATVAFPVAGGSYGTAPSGPSAWAGAISGTASEFGLAGLESVQVSILRAIDGAYWNGSAFVASNDPILVSSVLSGSSWSLAFTRPSNGTYFIQAVATDIAGNSAVGAPTSFAISTDAPAAPSTPVLATASDSGNSNSDHITNVTTPTFTGTAQPGSTVTLYEGTTVLGTGIAAVGTGVWSITSSPLSNGLHQITATATDAATNVSDSSAALAVTVDAQAPTSSISFPASGSSYNVAGWTGTLTGSASDTGLAGLSSVQLSILRVSDGFYWNGSAFVSSGSPLLVQASVTGSTWSYAFARPTDGSYIVQTTATDVAGNAANSAPAAFAVDTVAPNAPPTPVLATASDSGSSSSDHLTKITTPLFSGTAEPGTTVTLYDTDGTTVVGTGVAAAGTGIWSITSSALSNGAHVLTAKAHDAAGNASAASGSVTVTIDAQAPTSVIAFPAAGGSYNAAGWTGPITGSASDTGVAGLSSVQLTIVRGSDGYYWDGSAFVSSGSPLLVSAVITGPTWSYTFARPADGSYSIQATATDLAGNATASSSVGFVVDTQTPTVAIAAPVAAGNYSAAGSGVHQWTGSVSGTASDAGPAGLSTVKLSIVRGSDGYFWNGTSFVSSGSPLLVTATISGSTWTYAFARPADGSYSVQATATDLAGNTTTSSSIGFAVDTQAPSVAITAPVAGASYSSAVSGPNAWTGAISGTATEFGPSGLASVQVSVQRSDGQYWNGTAFVSSGSAIYVSATITGTNWSYAFARPADGTYFLRTRATDQAANTTTTAPLSFSVATVAPAIPSTPILASASDSGSSNSDRITNVAIPTFVGTAVPGTTVTLYNGVTVLGTGIAAAGTGAWSITSSALANGAYAVTATATDAAGNASAASPSVAVTIDASAPSSAVTFPASGSSYNVAGWTGTLTGSASDNGLAGLSSVQLSILRVSDGFYWNGSAFVSSGSPLLVTAGIAGSTWSYAFAQPTDGSYIVQTTATDVAGNAANSAPAAFAVDTVAPNAPPTPVLATASDSGSSSSDHLTKITTPLFSGTAEPGTTVSLYDTDGTTVVGTGVAAAGTGIWSITSSALSNGTHVLTAKAHDAAGNASVASGSVSVTIDAQAPTSVISFPGTGSYDSISWTGTITGTVDGTGTAPTEAVLTIRQVGGSELYWNGTDGFTSVTPVALTATLTGSTWSYVFARPADGSYVVTSTTTDTAGNAQSSATSVQFTIKAFNVAPVLTVPTAQTVNEDTALVLNSIAVSDVDAGTNAITVTLGVQHGTVLVTAGVSGGLTVGGIAGNGTNSVTLTGTLAEINATLLAGVTYQGTLNYNGSDTLTVGVTDEGNTGLGGALTDTESVAITVTAVNDTPTVATPLGNVTVLEDATVSTISLANVFADVDIATNEDSLTYSVESSDPTLVTAAIVDGSVVLTYLGNQNGTATITVTATDAANAAISTSFGVTVTAVNDAPTVESSLGNVTVQEDATVSTISLANVFADVDIATNEDSLTYSVVSSEPTLVTAAIVDGSVVLTYLGDQNGTATITVTATDAAGAAISTSFGVTVTAVNDAPTVESSLGNVTVQEDASVSTISLANVFADVDIATNEDSLTYSVSSSNTDLVTAAIVDGSVVLTYLGNQNGTATITVTATDAANAAISTSFGVTVTAVNDAPTVESSLGNVTVQEDATVSTISLANVFADVDIATNEDSLTYSVVSSEPTLVTAAIVDGSVVLTYLGNQNGTATITVTATDAAGAAISTSFGVTVTAVNDAPTVESSLGNVTVQEDASVSTISLANVFADVDIVTNEDSLTYSVESSDPTLVTAAIVDGSVVLTYLGDQNGTATITVTATDAAGAAISTSFGVTVTAVNDAPTVETTLAPVTVEEDASVSTISLANVFADVDIATNEDSLTYSVESSDPTLVTAAIVDGSVVLTYLGNQNGTATITVTATDSANAAISTSFGVTVTAVNDAPTVESSLANVTVQEDATVSTISLAGVFADVDIATNEDSLTYSVESSDPTLVTAAIVDGSVVLTYLGNQNGTATITVTATDAANAAISTSFGVTVTAVNDAPTVESSLGNVTVQEDASVSTISLANVFADVDIATNEDSLTYSVSSSNTDLVTAAIVDGSVVLTYLGDQNGTATITVTATDAANAAISTSFGVTVTAVNDAPTVESSLANVTVQEDATVSTISLANVFADVDIATNEDSLTYSVVSSEPTLVTAAIVDGSVVLTYLGNQNGTATITVTATDAAGAAISTSFGVTVTAVNDAPTVESSLGNVTVQEDASVSTISLANVFADVDIATNEDSLTYSVSSSNTDLVTAAIVDGSVVLTYLGNQNGTATITVTATDSANAAISTSFGVTVTAVNDAPTVESSLGNVTVQEDASVSTISLANVFADVDIATNEDSLTYSVSSSNTDLVTAAIVDGSVVLTYLGNQNGTATITVTATDAANAAISTSFGVTVTAVNDAPTVESSLGNVTVQEDATVSTISLANVFADVDIATNEDSLTYSVVSSEPTLVTAAIVDGSVVLTYLGNQNGTATITVTATDAANAAISTSFGVTVTAVNDAPTVESSLGNVTVQEDATVSTISLANVFADVDIATNEDSLTYSVSSSNTDLVTAAIVDGSVVLTYLGNQNGTATITVTATDAADAAISTSFGVTVTAVNDAPTVESSLGNVTVQEDATVSTISLANVFADVDIATNEDSLTYSVSSSNTDLVTAAIVDGSVVLTYLGDQNGTATITVTATDAAGAAISTSFGVTVTAVNDAPTVESSLGNVTVQEDASVSTISLANVFADVDIATNEDSLTYSVESSEPTLVTAAIVDGSVVLTYLGNQNGTATITVTATDAADAAISTSFGVTVTAVNDAPTAASQSLTTDEDTTLTVVLSSTDVETLPAALNFTITSLPTHGTLSYLGNPVTLGQQVIGSPVALLYTPVGNYNGSDGFTYSVTDGGDGSAAATTSSGTVAITVAAVNDAPQLTVPGAQTAVEDTDKLITGISVSDLDAGTSPISVTLIVAHGTVTVSAAESGGLTAGGISGNGSGSLTLTGSQAAINATLAAGVIYKGTVNYNGSDSLAITVSDGGNTGSGGAKSATNSVAITITEVNDTPTSTGVPVANVTVAENPGLVPLGLTGLAYSAGPGDEPQDLIYTVTSLPSGSLGQVVLSNGTTPVTLGSYSLAAIQGMKFFAADDANGSGTFSFTVTDTGTTNGAADPKTLVQSLTITITEVNNPPVLTAGSVNNLTVAEDSGTTSMGFAGLTYSAGPANEAQALIYTVTTLPSASLGQVVLSNGTTPVTLKTYLLSEIRGMRFVPVANANGSGTFSFTVTDSGTTNGVSDPQTLTETVTITVTEVNDTPLVATGSVNNLTVLEDSGTTTLGLTGVTYSAGPGEDSTQLLTYTVTVIPDPALGSVQLLDGTPVTTGTPYTLTQIQGMKFVAVANANGSGQFRFVVTDDGTTDGGYAPKSLIQTIVITVTPVNDAPSFTPGNNVAVLEDSAPYAAIWATVISVGPANESAQTPTFHVSNNNSGLFSVQPAIAANGILTFTPSANANGVATVSVSLQDSGDGSNVSPTVTFTITITPVNDAPSFTRGPDLSVSPVSGPHTSTWATSILAGPTVDESSQSLEFVVTNNANGLFAVQPTIDSSGTLRFTAAVNANGTATVSVFLRDNGGTADSGANQSSTVTFTITVDSTTPAPTITTPVFLQDFQSNSDGWMLNSSGEPNIPRDGDGHGVVNVTSSSDAGPFTRFGGYSASFPQGGYSTSLDIFLDPANVGSISNGSRFSYTSAINSTTLTGGLPTHLRDFAFNAGYYNDDDGVNSTPRFEISVATGAPGNPRAGDSVTIEGTGWYRFEHRFYDNGSGVLAVELTIRNAVSGELVKTWTLSQPSDRIGVNVGGNRYGWFAADQQIPNLKIDNSTLIHNLLTTDNTPTISGIAEPGSSVAIFLGTNPTAIATVSADVSTGAWTYTSPSLSDGTYKFTAKATDEVGNVSTVSQTLVIQVDTTAPTTPTITPTDFTQTFDSNGDGWDGVTASSGHGVVLSGSSSSSNFTRFGGYEAVFPQGGYTTSLDIYFSTSSLQAASTPNNTRFEYSSAINRSALDGGGNTLHLRDFVFSAGFYNDSDSTGTGARIVIGTSNNAGSNPKSLATPLTIKGNGWFRFQHRFYDNGSGILAVELRVIDLNSGAILKTWTLSNPNDVISTTVGGHRYGWFPTQQFPSLTVDNSTLVHNQPTMTGTAEPGSTVAVYLDGSSTPLGTVLANAITGKWSFTSSVLGEGSYTFTATATDIAGNVSVASAPHVVVIDTIAPTVAGTSIALVDPGSSTPESVDFTVTFAEKVTGVGVDDFTLVTTGTISGSVVTGVTSEDGGKTYTVTVGGYTGTGTITLYLNNNRSIADLGGNTLALDAGWDLITDSHRSTPLTSSIEFLGAPVGTSAPNGRVQFTVGSNGDSAAELVIANFGGTRLADLTALSYSALVSTPGASVQSIYIRLDIDFNGDGNVDDLLLFEPAYQTGTYPGATVPNQGAVTTGVWQDWNALTGGWWSVAAGTGGPPVVTLASYLSAHPDATIVNPASGLGGIRIVAGYGAGAWNNFVGSVANVTISTATTTTTFPAINPTASVTIGAESLRLASSPIAPETAPGALTPDALAPIVSEAISRWQAAGISQAQLAILENATIQIADLSGDLLGQAVESAGVIVIDQDAAGFGWYVDQTPADDGEFGTEESSEVRNHADLLSVVLHEMGHLLGLDHDHGDDVMNAELPLGVRNLPEPTVVTPFVKVSMTPSQSAPRVVVSQDGANGTGGRSALASSISHDHALGAFDGQDQDDSLLGEMARNLFRVRRHGRRPNDAR
ncbi:Ig-like domain-containing protein [Singulisphaera sp. Ch08]|uniref:Ig-like domain-containing protein n=1 Tax=Singulisphaera sp. Ch08 TaxID=3120278 RepID=A0AAU7CR28_9BACT